jgi:hypothetical protein
VKVAAVSIIVLALVIGIVPQVTDCHSQGRTLALANGNTTEMKCYWSAMAEIALAVPLLAVGATLATSRRREARRDLGMVGTVLGALVILVPTALIGVCANNAMLCKSIMQPTLVLSGTLVAAASLATLVTAWGSGTEQFA